MYCIMNFEHFHEKIIDSLNPNIILFYFMESAKLIETIEKKKKKARKIER